MHSSNHTLLFPCQNMVLARDPAPRPSYFPIINHIHKHHHKHRNHHHHPRWHPQPIVTVINIMIQVSKKPPSSNPIQSLELMYAVRHTIITPHPTASRASLHGGMMVPKLTVRGIFTHEVLARCGMYQVRSGRIVE
jgi:hypothetical protein